MVNRADGVCRCSALATSCEVAQLPGMKRRLAVLTVRSVQMSADAKKHLHYRKFSDVSGLGCFSVDGLKKHPTPHMRLCALALALALMRALEPMVGGVRLFLGCICTISKAGAEKANGLGGLASLAGCVDAVKMVSHLHWLDVQATQLLIKSRG